MPSPAGSTRADARTSSRRTCRPSSGELAVIAIIVGPSACASRTRSAQAVARSGVHVDLNRRRRRHHRRARGAGLAGGEERLHRAVAGAGVDALRGRATGRRRADTRPRPAWANAPRSTARSADIAAMAGNGPVIGGPDSSTAPPGSTVIALPPGSGGVAAMASLISVPAGRRIGSDRSKQCASTSSPTQPAGPSCRQSPPTCRAALYALVSSADVDMRRVRVIHLGRDGAGHVCHAFRVGNARAFTPSSRDTDKVP